MALNNEDKKDVKVAFGKKVAGAVSRATHDGFDGNKRWGNSGIKGVGANSPAMMEARKAFSKKNNLAKKIGPSGYRITGEPPPRSRTSDAAAGGIDR